MAIELSYQYTEDDYFEFWHVPFQADFPGTTR